jgi:hypothetical protein
MTQTGLGGTTCASARQVDMMAAGRCWPAIITNPTGTECRDLGYCRIENVLGMLSSRESFDLM